MGGQGLLSKVTLKRGQPMLHRGCEAGRCKCGSETASGRVVDLRLAWQQDQDRAGPWNHVNDPDLHSRHKGRPLKSLGQIPVFLSLQHSQPQAPSLGQEVFLHLCQLVPVMRKHRENDFESCFFIYPGSYAKQPRPFPQSCQDKPQSRVRDRCLLGEA